MNDTAHANRGERACSPLPSLDEAQTAAVRDCIDLRHRLVAVSGPAGSGKTTIIRDVARALREQGVAVALAAPTGKAARRIKEATGFEAVTLHRLLEFPRPDEFDPVTGDALFPTKPRRHKKRPLDALVVLVDEYAMVGWDIHQALMNAMPAGGCVRIFGDEAQLAPIERVRYPTSPFQMLIKTGKSHELSRIYRQDEGSAILVAAKRVREGSMPHRASGVDIEITDATLGRLRHVLNGNPSPFAALACQIISPSRRGQVGTHALNVMLQERFNPKPRMSILLPRHRWAHEFRVRVAVGDKVVCTENIYDLRDWGERYEEWSKGRPKQHSFIPAPANKQVLNGEIGIVKAILHDGALEIDFGDRMVEVPTEVEEFYAHKNRVFTVDYRRSIDLAYALTTHKCQGSEFERVIYLLDGLHWFNLSRRNFYTGLTRARKLVSIIGEQRALLRSLSYVG